MGKTFIKNLTGKQFGEWTALRFVPTNDVVNWWECKCSCGIIRLVRAKNLTLNVSKSCGCTTGRRGLNATGHPLYSLWNGIVNRCRNPKNPNYPRYGAKGIGICDEWANDLFAFVKYIGPRPTPKHTVDRIETSKGYEPGNVRWATVSQQQNNKKNNVNLTVNGRTQTAAEWAREMGINRTTIYNRIKAGYSDAEAVLTPATRSHRERAGGNKMRPKILLTHSGQTLTCDEWAKIVKINPATLANRKKRGWSDEKTLTTPVQERNKNA